MSRTLNFLLYQIGWFACVWGATSSHPSLAIAVAVGLVAVHMGLTTQPISQSKLLMASFAIGLTVDTTLLAIGVCQFPTDSFVVWLPPVWMSILWIQFATTLRYSLLWISGRYGLAALLGLVCAPLAFLAGERMGAIQFLDPRVTSVGMLGLFWSAAMPLLVYVSDRLHASEKTITGYRGFRQPSPGKSLVDSEVERHG